MRKKLLVLLCFLCMFAVFLTACDNGGNKGEDTAAPEIVVENVPQSGMNGRPVTVPKATARDDFDGDVSAKIKLTVAQLKEDGSVRKELLYQVSGNVENEFKPSGALMNYSIVFTVKDSAGNKAEKKFAFTATPDTAAPVIALDTASFPNFSLETGIVGQYATKDIVIPTATAKDAPDDFDVSENINVSIVNEDTEEYVKTFYGIAEIVPFRLIRGKYRAVYSCADGAGNLAKEVSFPLVVDKLSDGENLAQDKNNFAEGYNVVYNEYNEYVVGMTPDSPNQTINSSCVTFKTDKIYDDIVAVRINMDPLGKSGGETLYDFAFRGSKNYEYSAPTGKEGEWAPYLVWRYDNNAGMTMFGYPGGAAPAAVSKGYNGRLDDGKDHTLYFQIVNEGESSQAEDAKIVMRLWVDTLPTNDPSMEGYVARGDSTGKGTLEAGLFDEMWNAYGWFSVGSISTSKDDFGKYNEDALRLKGITLYAADEVSFDCDIVAPELNFREAPAAKYDTGKDVTFVMPEAVSDGEDISDQVKVYLTDPHGVRKAVTGSVNVAEAGMYKLTYVVADEHGNYQYRDFDVRFIVFDDVPPVIEVDTADIEVSVNEVFTIPAASASDNLMGDLTASVVVDLEGPQAAQYINYNNNTSYSIGAIGTHYLVYRVEDLSENVTEVRVKVVVTGEKTGNVLVTDAENMTNLDASTGTVSLGKEQYTMYNGQYVYDKKVSLIVNVKNSQLFMFGVHGMFNNNGIWLDTMTLSFASDGKIYLSLSGYNNYLIATSDENPFSLEWYQNIDVRIEYRTFIETIEGEDYLHFELFVNDKAIAFQAAGESSAHVKEDGSVLLAVKDVPAQYQKALHAGKFFLGCQNQELTLKELRIDGTSCDLPEPPVEPEGFDMPEFGAKGTVNESMLNSPVRQDTTAVVVTASNQDRVYVKFTVDETGTPPIYALQLCGADDKDAWATKGISLFFNNNTLFIGTGWGKFIANASFPLIAKQTCQLSYRLTYVEGEGGKFIGLQVEVWGVAKVEDTAVWQKLSFNKEQAFEGDLGADKTAPVIGYGALGGSSKIAPSPLVVSALASSKAAITILAASVDTEMAPEIPTKPEITGIPYPQFSAENNVSAGATLAKEEYAALCDYLPDGERLYFTLNTNLPEGFKFYLQLTGGVENVWPQGIVLEFGADGVYMHINGNASWSSYADCALQADTDMKFAVEMRYEKNGDEITAMNVLLLRDTGDGYQKVAFRNHNDKDCVIDGELVLPLSKLSESLIAPNKVVVSVIGDGVEASFSSISLGDKA